MLGDEGRPVDSGDGSTRRRDALFGPKRSELNTRIGSRFPLRTRHGPFQDRKVAVVDARAFGSERLCWDRGARSTEGGQVDWTMGCEPELVADRPATHLRCERGSVVVV